MDSSRLYVALPSGLNLMTPTHEVVLRGAGRYARETPKLHLQLRVHNLGEQTNSSAERGNSHALC